MSKPGWVATSLMVATLTGCSAVSGTGAPVVVAPEVPATSTGAPAKDSAHDEDTGIVAEPTSTAFPLQASNIRLVRIDDQDLALQFELFNGGRDAVQPYDVGMGLIERDFKLVDTSRATSYDVQQSTGFDGRVSDNQYDEIAPGTANTITAVFTAPPADATKLLFMTDVTRPVEVPIQPAGSIALEDDPVLAGSRGEDPRVNTLICTSKGAEAEGAQTPLEIKLPGDVLFASGKSDLTPAAEAALDEVEAQLGSATGTITIEGHTDAVGDDPSNQQLSEARAASVQAALQSRLGSEFSFDAVGFGETRPVAPNTNPDGGDNPDGRAQNRRVEIRSGDLTAVAPPELQARPLTDDLAAQGARARVDSVKRVGAHLLTTVTLSNPTSTAIEVDTDSGLTNPGHRPIGITVADRTRMLRSMVCTTGSEHLGGFSVLTGPPSNEYTPSGASLLPGESVQLWGIYAAPPAEISTVDVEIGGLGAVESAPITG